MTSEQSLPARAAFTCILGVLTGQFLATARLTQDDNFPVLAWLAFAITCGIVLQSQEIGRLQLALSSAAAPTCLAFTMAFLIFHRGHAYITGVEVKAADPRDVAEIVGLILIVSYVGIYIFSFAHRYILWLVKSLIDASDELLQKIDSRLKWTAGIITSLGYVAKKFLS